MVGAYRKWGAWCIKRDGCSRQQFYDIKKAEEEHGIEGLNVFKERLKVIEENTAKEGNVYKELYGRYWI
jgi:hypothetical protein